MARAESERDGGVAFIAVEVAYSPRAGEVDCVALRMAPGSTVADALSASGLLERHRLDAAGLRIGVWCKARQPDTVLRERDRVEIYRPLLVDPKEARRQRYQKHRQRAAELAGAEGPRRAGTGR